VSRSELRSALSARRVRARALAHDYGLHAFILCFTVAMLVADGRLRALGPQLGIGIVTFLVLWVCARRVEPVQRLQLWLCVLLATGFEAIGSLVWGGYRYRLHNIPLYVPPGHALVYLFGITAVSLPIMRRHGHRIRRLVFTACTAWALAGVTVLPLVTGRLDVQGALLLPLFAWCIFRSGRGELFAAIWVATSTVEIAGTWAGDWAWGATAPWTHIPSGNPPSAIAAGYAVIDGSVVLLAPVALLALQRVSATRAGHLVRTGVRALAPSRA
jgi:hypothetical protein